jgi:hypothetical protein
MREYAASKAIQRTDVETVVKRAPKAFISEVEIKAVQAKQWLTLEGGNFAVECVAFDVEAVGVDWKGQV